MDNVIDLLLLEWNKQYPKLEQVEDEIEQQYSKQRKLLNEIVSAVVILYSSKNGRP